MDDNSELFQLGARRSYFVMTVWHPKGSESNKYYRYEGVYDSLEKAYHCAELIGPDAIVLQLPIRIG